MIRDVTKGKRGVFLRLKKFFINRFVRSEQVEHRAIFSKSPKKLTGKHNSKNNTEQIFRKTLKNAHEITKRFFFKPRTHNMIFS